MPQELLVGDYRSDSFVHVHFQLLAWLRRAQIHHVNSSFPVCDSDGSAPRGLSTFLVLATNSVETTVVIQRCHYLESSNTISWTIKMSKRRRAETLADDEGAISSSPSPAPATDASDMAPSPKYVHLENDINSVDRKPMYCSLPPHEKLSFPSIEEYEVHYHQNHVNRCNECGRNFPSDHFLQLHIAENHDPINEAKKERGDKIVRSSHTFRTFQWLTLSSMPVSSKAAISSA
jgi:hypothetical protein